jgi:hypothetical protein
MSAFSAYARLAPLSASNSDSFKETKLEASNLQEQRSAQSTLEIPDIGQGPEKAFVDDSISPSLPTNLDESPTSQTV